MGIEARDNNLRISPPLTNVSHPIKVYVKWTHVCMAQIDQLGVGF